MAKTESYYQNRLNSLNITTERNSIQVENMEGLTQNFQFFSENKNGDIVINYLHPGGLIEYYEGKKGKEKNLQEFVIKILRIQKINILKPLTREQFLSLLPKLSRHTNPKKK